MPDTENKDSIKEVYANDFYRLDIDGGIIREIDVNIVTFINLANLKMGIDINSLNDKNVFTNNVSVGVAEDIKEMRVVEAIISKLKSEDVDNNEGITYRHYRIQSTSINQLPHIDYLMEYDIYDESYMDKVTISGEIDTSKLGTSNAPYIGELHSYNNGSLTDKVLKVIFPVEFVGTYDLALIGKYSGSGEITYSYSLVSKYDGQNIVEKVSGIASVVYTSKSKFEGVSSLIKNIHVSNYSRPHLFQNNSLSTAANLNKLMDTRVRINERNFINTVPYKNIIMHKDYSIQFIGNYLYGNTNSN